MTYARLKAEHNKRVKLSGRIAKVSKQKRGTKARKKLSDELVGMRKTKKGKHTASLAWKRSGRALAKPVNDPFGKTGIH